MNNHEMFTDQGMSMSMTVIIFIESGVRLGFVFFNNWFVMIWGPLNIYILITRTSYELSLEEIDYSEVY